MVAVGLLPGCSSLPSQLPGPYFFPQLCRPWHASCCRMVGRQSPASLWVEGGPPSGSPCEGSLQPQKATKEAPLPVPWEGEDSVSSWQLRWRSHGLPRADGPEALERSSRKPGLWAAQLEKQKTAIQCSDTMVRIVKGILWAHRNRT